MANIMPQAVNPIDAQENYLRAIRANIRTLEKRRTRANIAIGRTVAQVTDLCEILSDTANKTCLFQANVVIAIAAVTALIVFLQWVLV